MAESASEATPAGLSDEQARKIIEHFKRDRFADLASITTLKVDQGYAKVKMQAGPEHLNSLNMLHGGAVFTIADMAFALASNADGRAAVAANVSINFHQAGGTGTIYAEGREVAKSNRLGTYQIEVTNEAGELLATMTGLAYRLSQSLAEARERFAGGSGG